MDTIIDARKSKVLAFNYQRLEMVNLRIVTLLLFIFISRHATGQSDAVTGTITVLDKNELQHLTHQIFYLEDVDGSLTIDDIQKPEIQQQFIRNKDAIFSRPATTSTYWFKITVQNHCEEDTWIEVGTIFAWYLDFYSPDSLGIYNKHETGSLRPRDTRFFDNDFFWLPVNKAGEKKNITYYLRIQEEFTFEAPLTIGTLRSLNTNHYRQLSIHWGFIGLVAVMFFYNLVIWILTKHNPYGIYSVYLALIILIVTYLNGFPLIETIFFWVDEYWWHKYLIAWGSLVNFVIGYFCIQYLSLYKHQKTAYKLILTLSILLGIIFPVLNLLGIRVVYLSTVQQAFVFMLYLSCLFSAYYLNYKGYKQARFYALGWTFFIISAVIFIFVINGYLPNYLFTRHSIYFGFAIEILMFSIALGDTLNILKIEREKAQAENLRIVNDQNILLEKKVKERTLELQRLNEDLRTKSNLLLEKNSEILAQNEEITSLVDQLKEKSDYLDNQNKRLTEANEEMEGLMAVVAHDLRAPFNRAKGLLGLVTSYIENAEANDLLRRLGGVIESGLQLLHEILDLNSVASQIPVGNFTTIAVRNFVQEEVLDPLTQAASDKRIILENKLDTQVTLRTDAASFRRIIENLVSNAIKFSPPDKRICVYGRLRDHHVEIIVQDQGLGFSDDDKKKVFKRFQRLSARPTGGESSTGLGLSIVKSLIEKLGGTIDLISEQGIGSEFIIRMPR